MGVGIDLPPVAIIGLLIGVFLIVGLVAFGTGIVKLFTPVIDEGSINNFNGLVSEIKSVLENQDAFVSNFKDNGRPFYLMDGVILVGYDYNQYRQYTTCSNEYATKPSQLFGKAGLCLHIEDNANNFDYDPQEPIQCYAFDENIIFLAPSDGLRYGGFGGSHKYVNDYGKQEAYEDLFLYGGECDIGEPDLGSTRLYVERFKKDDKVYIYLQEFDEKNKKNISERIDRIDKSIKAL